jgi:hypothetical protein
MGAEAMWRTLEVQPENGKESYKHNLSKNSFVKI